MNVLDDPLDGGDDIDRELRKLSVASDVDSELEALKAGVSTDKQLPEAKS